MDAVRAIIIGGAGVDGEQAYPLSVFQSIALRRIVPAAILVAEIVGKVGQRHELVGILMRVVEPAEDDVGAGADVGRDRRLGAHVLPRLVVDARSEEHTSELQSLMRISYAVFCLKKKK